MKLATLKDSTRDGRLVVVSSDLTRCSEVGHIARTLQAALDDWAYVGPRLANVAEGIEAGAQPTTRFHEHDAASPLPRAYHWATGSAAADFPLIHQAGSDAFSGPRDPIPTADDAWGINAEGAVAVIVGDVPMGASRDEALAAIRLVMLVNDVTLRKLIPAEPATAFYQSKPPAAFSPVAVSPDSLGDLWRGGRLHLPVPLSVNGTVRATAGAGMTLDFPTVIVQATKTRPLRAGAIIGLDSDNTTTPFLKFGDQVRIEMDDAGGHSIFGAIEQTVTRYEKP